MFENRFFLPNAALRPYVWRFWSTQIFPGAASTITHDVLPSPLTDLVLQFPGPGPRREADLAQASFRLRIMGAETRIRHHVLRPGDAAVGVSFRPGRAAFLLGPPAAEFTDKRVLLEDVWGRTAAELESRLREASSTSQAVAILQAGLENRLRARADDAALEGSFWDHLFRLRGQFRVEEAAAWSGKSPRQLHRFFLSRVGVGPKQFSRMLRFREALEMLRANRRPDWFQVLGETGYSDRPHLSREFQDFAAATPAQLLARLEDPRISSMSLFSR